MAHAGDQYTSLLCRQLFALQQAGCFCDMSVSLGDSTLSLHRAVLAASSPLLYDELAIDRNEGEHLKSRFDHLAALDSATLHAFVRYVYTGEIESECDMTALTNCCGQMGILTTPAELNDGQQPAGPHATGGKSAVHYYHSHASRYGRVDASDKGTQTNVDDNLEPEDTFSDNSMEVDQEDDITESSISRIMQTQTIKDSLPSRRHSHSGDQSDASFDSADDDEWENSADDSMDEDCDEVEGTYKCAACNQLFGSQAFLAQHKKNAHARCKPSNSRRFMCDKCNFGARTAKLLFCHAKSKHGVPLTQQDEFPVYGCPVESCGYSSLYPRSMVIHHENIHSGASNTSSSHFVCEQCGRVLKSRLAHAMHVRTHDKRSTDTNAMHVRLDLNTTDTTGETSNPSTSEQHGNTTDKPSALKSSPVKMVQTHQIKQTQMACPYQKDGCKYTAAKHRSLDRHVLLVHIRKDYHAFVCHLCGHQAKTQGTMNRHFKAQHPDSEYCIQAEPADDKPFMCHVCGSKWKSQSSMNSHIRNVHAEFATPTTRAAKLNNTINSNLLAHFLTEINAEIDKHATMLQSGDSGQQ